MENELKLPCPFCGDYDEVSVEETDPVLYIGFPWRVQCGACFGSIYDVTRAAAIAAWNARAGAPAIDAGEVERLVDNVAMKARAHTPWDDDTMKEYHEARAALLAAVTAAKGGR